MYVPELLDLLQPASDGALCQEHTSIEPCHAVRATRRKVCLWHWLLKQPRHLRAFWSANPYVSAWPTTSSDAIHQQCSECKVTVPSVFFMPRAKRCVFCNGAFKMNALARSHYRMGETRYMDLWKYQGWRCYICQKFPRYAALAVDHDHETGDVRGLLCAGKERGCNHALMSLVPYGEDGVAFVERMKTYLERPPFSQFQQGVVP